MTSAVLPFARAADTYGALAADMDALTGELTGVLSRFRGMSGLPIDAHMAHLGYVISYGNDLALSMSETAASCTQQNDYDEVLTEAPTPAEVAEAQRAAEAVARTPGAETWTRIALAEAAALAAARAAAVAEHAERTAGTCFEVPADPGWELPGGTCEPGGDEEGTPPPLDEGGYDDEEEEQETAPTDETETPVTPPEHRVPGLTTLDPVPSSPTGPGLTMAAEPVTGGTELSSSATPSATANVAPSGVYTPQPSVPTMQNAPTPASPSWMQPTTPTSTAQQRPYAASFQAKKEKAAREEREAEKWFAGGSEPATAVLATATHTAAPTATLTPSASSAPAPIPNAPAPSTPTGTQPSGGAPTGMVPGAAGQQPSKSTPAASKIVAAEQPKSLEELFDDALHAKPYEAPVRDGLLGPIVNPRVGAGR